MKHTLELCEAIHYESGEPLECFAAWRAEESSIDRLLIVDFDLEAYWLEGSPKLSLTAIYLESAGSYRVSVTNKPLAGSTSAPQDQYQQWSIDHEMVCYAPGQPIELQAIAIPKPWGQEIWYTGVEERGVCCFVQGSRRTPIPWLQAALPDQSLGDARQPLVLLKILDPASEPVIGDLYFELHQEKQEVYVVTHVDKTSWPDGVGYIRMGFDPQKLASFEGDSAAFRQSYLTAVRDYEAIRRQIDKLPPGLPVSSELRHLESKLRLEMDCFSQLMPLAVGDVVKVPLLTPHSLQHGVRTVEFQTPVYERKILSFAQRVLTQDHWDTQEAVELMTLEVPPVADHTIVEQDEGVLVERIVDFSDFEVRRTTLDEGAELSLCDLQTYAVAMVVEGDLTLGGVELGPEQALILPRKWSGTLKLAATESSGVFLLATPRH